MHQETPSKTRGARASTATRADSTTIFAIALALPLVLLSAAILLLALTSTGNQTFTIATQSAIDPSTEPSPAADSVPLASPDDGQSVQVEVQPTPIPELGSDERAAAPPAKQPNANLAAPAKATAPRPIVEGYNPDTYSLLSDLHAAIESGAWQDAAQIITSPRAAFSAGVAPDANDQSLLTTLPIAFRLAHQLHPQIRAALGDRFAALARLRIMEAIESADAVRLRLAIAQFPDTPAAAEAHQWLADQALAAGSFAAAIDHYEQAAKFDAGQKATLAPRLRLARALLGHDPEPTGDFARGTITFGDATLPAADFESLIAELKSSRSSRHDLVEQVVIPPASFKAAPPRLVKLKNPDPADSTRSLPNHRSANTDYVSLDDEAVFISSPFGLQANNLTNGDLLWHFFPNLSRGAVRPNAAPTRPLIDADRLYIRLPDASGSRLACLDKASGKQLWTTEIRERESIATDPLLADNQLVALAVKGLGDQHCAVRHYVIDRRSGRILTEHDVVQLRSDWSEHWNAEMKICGPHLIAAFSEATISLEAQGHLRWVRMSPPVVTTHNEPRRRGQRLLVHNGQAFLNEADANTILALDIDTGRLLWRAPLPPHGSLVGVLENRLIVCSPETLHGLGTEDGAEKWQQAVPHVLPQPLLGVPHVLVGQRLKGSSAADQIALRLTWIDAASGAVTASSDLPASEVAGASPQQLLAQAGRLACYVHHENGGHSLLELLPANHAAAVYSPNRSAQVRVERGRKSRP